MWSQILVFCDWAIYLCFTFHSLWTSKSQSIAWKIYKVFISSGSSKSHKTTEISAQLLHLQLLLSLFESVIISKGKVVPNMEIITLHFPPIQDCRPPNFYCLCRFPLPSYIRYIQFVKIFKWKSCSKVGKYGQKHNTTAKGEINNIMWFLELPSLWSCLLSLLRFLNDQKMLVFRYQDI